MEEWNSLTGSRGKVRIHFGTHLHLTYFSAGRKLLTSGSGPGGDVTPDKTPDIESLTSSTQQLAVTADVPPPVLSSAPFPPLPTGGSESRQVSEPPITAFLTTGPSTSSSGPSKGMSETCWD